MVNVGVGMVSKTSAMAPSVTSMDGMNMAIDQGQCAGDHREGTWGAMNQPCSSGFYSEFEGREHVGGGEIYDGMALPEHFLGQYYTRVRK